MFVWLELRPLHDEQPRQDVYEDPLHPGRHLVRLRRPEVHVQDHNRHAYTAMKFNIVMFVWNHYYMLTLLRPVSWRI